MFFKLLKDNRRWILSVAAVGVATLALCKCGLKTNERPRRPQPPSFSGKGYSCVGQIPDTFERYFNDNMGEFQLNEFFHCLEQSLTSFAQLTRGQDAATYAPEEIRRFLQSYFLKDRPISDQFLHEFMVAKQALIGGEVNRISRNELYIAVDLLEDLRKELIRLKPHITVLNPNLAENQAPQGLADRLASAQAALGQTITVFVSRLQKNPRLFTFADLQSLMTEFRIYTNWEQHFPTTKPVSAWVNMLRSFKIATVSPQEPRGIAGREWTPLLTMLSRWYLTYLQYRVGVKDQRVIEGVGLQNFEYLAKSIFNLVQDAIDRQPLRVLTFDQIMNLVESAQSLGWMSEKLRLCGLRSSIQGIVMRMFGDPRVPPDLRSGDLGLSRATLLSIRTDFYRWVETQNDLDSLFKAPLRAHQDNSTLHQTRLQPDILAQLHQTHAADWLEFLRLRDHVARPLYPEEIPRLYLVTPNNFAKYNLTAGFYDLSMLNILRSITTAVFRGYARDGVNTDGLNTGIRSSEMQRFYEDFRETGVDLELIDQRRYTAGQQAFIEGNLFTYAASGLRPEVPDDANQPNPIGRLQSFVDWTAGNEIKPAAKIDGELTFVETLEYFAFLHSEGKMADDFYAEFMRVCPLGPPDQYHKITLDRSCVIRELPDVIMRLAPSMPGLQDYLRQTTPDLQKAFSDNVIGTAMAVYSSERFVEYSELTTVGGLLHYIEGVMTRYDRNGDGILDLTEVNDAAQTFAGYIQSYVEDQNHFMIPRTLALGIFRYILYYHALPADASWERISNLLHIGLIFDYPSRVGKMAVTRGDLSYVFHLIIKQVSAGKPKQHMLHSCVAPSGATGND